jgi:ATP-dependent DNA helicase RecG
MKQSIFISSVQKELAEERRALKSYILGDTLLGRFFDVFLFEDMPAADRRADKVYLDQVDRCDVYLGILGNEYGYEDDQGVSPTEREFDRATAAGKQRLIFVKGENDAARQPKMQALVRKAGGRLIRRRFNSIPELTTAVYASLVTHLDRTGVIQNRPFDEQPCPGSSLDDIARGALADFVRTARAERRFPLAARTPTADVLEHLHMLADGRQPTRAAVLLFGRDPQRFMASAEIRCMHFHGTEVQRPAPYYKIFKGSLFEQVDQAANFVLSVTNVSVGTRALGPQAPVRLEIPRDVIQEAIVNAVVHRDYTSNAAIQVAVFSDRVEIWNPGELLPPLTPDSLRVPHRSIARNHRICESMFLAGYIEKYGTGTLMMIRESVEHALPEPIFKQSGGEFVAVVGRDWLTEELLARLDLNDRQFRAVMHVKLHGYLTNSAYRGIVGVSESTALRDLRSLAAMGLLKKTEGTGRNARYELISGKPVVNPSNPSSPSEDETRHKPVKPVKKGDIKGAHGASALPKESAINRPNRTSQATKTGSQTAHTAQPPSPESRPESKPANRASASKRKKKGGKNG